MDTIESLGSTEYAHTRILILIDRIGSACTSEELTYRFGQAVGFITATVEMKVIKEGDWDGLLRLAESSYERHAMSSGDGERFTMYG